MSSRLLFVAATAVTLLLSACSRTPTADGPPPAPDDEAKRTGRTLDSFRYPVSKTKNNFFAGMDVVAAPKGSTPDNAMTGIEALPADQLIDVRMQKAADAAKAASAAQPATAQAPTDAQAPATPPAAPAQPPAPVNPERALIDAVTTPNEILGRNTWMAWCGGNEGFWDWLAGNSYGFLDFLKLVDTRNRSNRFQEAGLINDPGMKQSTTQDEYGLWLDTSSNDPNGQKDLPQEEIYGKSSGVIGLRLFKNPAFEQAKAKWDAKRYYEDPSYYNDPNLIRPYRVGMSCAFCHASFHPLNPPANVAEPRWENISGNIGAQYLRIRAVVGNLLKKDNLVYHILDSQPPGTVDTSLVASDNIDNPNAMNSIFGLKQRVILSFKNPPERELGSSLTQPALWGNPTDHLAPGEDGFVWKSNPATHKLDYRGQLVDKVPQAYWDAFANSPVPPIEGGGTLLDRVKNSNTPEHVEPGAMPPPRYVPRILFDGADSIGGWGALARVYLNIGTYWERWIQIHNPLVGFQKQYPFAISDCVNHSLYWQATQERVAPLRDYFLKVSTKMPLLAAKGAGEKTDSVSGARFLLEGALKKEGSEEFKAQATDSGKSDKDIATERAKHIDTSKLAHGRKVFAHNCIVCHSSIQFPARVAEMQAWASKEPPEPYDHDPGHWLKDDQYIAWAEKQVETDAFWTNNYLSTDYRVPITLVGTNSQRAVATNGLRGDMWNDFTSEAYKRMPSVGSIRYFNPYAGPAGEDQLYTPRNKTPEGSPVGGGGIGFYRVPTLISIWSTAPLLHNNSLGLFNNDPSVDGRLVAFDDAIRKLLWPEKRFESSSYNEATPERLKKDHGLIWRTTETTYIDLPSKYLPSVISKIPGLGALQSRYEQGAKKCSYLKAILEPVLFGRSVPWLPSVVLFVVAYFCFLCIGRRPSPDPAVVRSRRHLARWIGYFVILTGLLLGAFIYVVTGNLGNLRIGPIPKGTPVSLLANANPDADPKVLKKALATTLTSLAEIGAGHLSVEETETKMRKEVAPALLSISRCPDFVMDKGHYYPWFDTMSDDDKDALIELLKTF